MQHRFELEKMHHAYAPRVRGGPARVYRCVYKLTCWSRIRAEVSLKFYSSRPILLDVRVQALVLVSIRAEVSLKFHSSPSRPSGRSLARD